MGFYRYQRLERYGMPKVKGIEYGTCYVFPKIDGTNTSVWFENGVIEAGSRNRKLSLEKDHFDFLATIKNNKAVERLLKENPGLRLFGEWLVPHTLKTYREDAWNKFYVFDVGKIVDGDIEYMHYEDYAPILDEYGIEYIAPLSIIKNGNWENFTHFLDGNDYLIKDGEGDGEGLVIKNYDFRDAGGHQVWAKIVTSEFREKHRKDGGWSEIEFTQIENKIINDFVTEALVEKEADKLIAANKGFENKLIPILFKNVWHELINEEMWNIVNKYKNPMIDFSRLHKLTIDKIKTSKPELFGK